MTTQIIATLQIIFTKNPPEADVVEAAEKAIQLKHDPVNNQLVTEAPTVRHKRFNGFVDGDSRPKSIVFMRLTEEQRERDSKRMMRYIIDTKHLAFSHSKLQILSEWSKDVLSLIWVIDPTFTEYKLNDTSLYHEAGYDAYVTRFIFAHLVAFMLHENEEEKRNAYSCLDDVPEGDIPVKKKVDDEPVEEQDENNMDSEEKKFIDLMWTSPKVIGYYNKLHLMRSDFKYLNLTDSLWKARREQRKHKKVGMGEITIVSWEEWIRDIVWEDVDQKQAEKENEDSEEENGEGSDKELDETISTISSTKSEQERPHSAASSCSIKSLLSNLDNMAWPLPADRLPFPTKDGEATHSAEVNSYAEETWARSGSRAMAAPTMTI
ncbi:8421_t:CDS:2 [Paraglomus brasilianum]|uniref:8421_t:CDS:1 n=1 Tax=Paraglomus brasilianum TaxID=144538 RepID=A0A9N9BWG1_9GLOM|nr:8421_t:CDS:2 [Paraglomus brasilianum]